VMCAEQGACVRRRSWAGYTIYMFEFEFPTGTGRCGRPNDAACPSRKPSENRPPTGITSVFEAFRAYRNQYAVQGFARATLGLNFHPLTFNHAPR
jgi:hypothetical protein